MWFSDWNKIGKIDTESHSQQRNGGTTSKFSACNVLYSQALPRCTKRQIDRQIAAGEKSIGFCFHLEASSAGMLFGMQGK